MNTIDNSPVSTNLFLNKNTTHHGFSITLLISAIEEMNNKMRDADYQYSISQSVNQFNSAEKILDEKKEAAEKNARKSRIDSAFKGLAMVTSVGLTTVKPLADNGFSKTSRAQRRNAQKLYYAADAHLSEVRAGRGAPIKDIESRMGYQQRVAQAEAERDKVAADFKLRLSEDPARNLFGKSVTRNYDVLNGSRHSSLAWASDNSMIVSQGMEALGTGLGVRSGLGASSLERQAEMDANFEHFFEKDADSYAQKARSVSQQTMQAVESLVSVLNKLQDALTLK